MTFLTALVEREYPETESYSVTVNGDYVTLHFPDEQITLERREFVAAMREQEAQVAA